MATPATCPRRRRSPEAAMKPGRLPPASSPPRQETGSWLPPLECWPKCFRDRSSPVSDSPSDPMTQPPNNPTTQRPNDPSIQVAVAIIREGDRVLLTRRQKGKHLEGLWEFP